MGDSMNEATAALRTPWCWSCPRLAVEIVKARPFRSLAELVKARGIGEKLLRKLREHLTV
jgi:hypothetical protein